MRDEFSANEPVAQRPSWLQLFPWAGVNWEGDLPEWMPRPILAQPNEATRGKVSLIARHALNHYGGARFAALFPNVAGQDLASFPLTHQCRVTLLERGLIGGFTVWHMTLGEFARGHSPNASVTHSLVRAMIQVTLIQAASTFEREISANLHIVDRIAADVHLVAEYHIVRGEGSGKILTLDALTEANDDVLAAADRLRSLNWLHAVGESVYHQTRDGEINSDLQLIGWGAVHQHLERVFAALTDRELAIFVQRSAAAHPATLAELGEQFGVSQQRVRQVEAKLLQKLSAVLRTDAEVSQHVDRLIHELYTPVLLDEMGVQESGLQEEVAGVGLPLLTILVAVCDELYADDEWISAAPLDRLCQRTSHIVDRAINDYGVASVRSVQTLCEDEVLGPIEHFEDWLLHCGFTVKHEQVFRKFRNQTDRAAAELFAVGSPVTVEALAAQLGGVSEQSLTRRLTEDHRFVRTGDTTWGLADWDVREYTTVSDALADMVDDHGGSLPMQRARELMREHFDVAAGNVDEQASMAPLRIHDGSVERLRDSTTIAQPPTLTAGVFRHRDRYAYRFTVTEGHVRGDGVELPVALGKALGMTPGSQRTFVIDHGSCSVTWEGLYPVTESLHLQLAQHGVDSGDEVFVVLRDGGELHVSPVPAEDDKNYGRLPAMDDTGGSLNVEPWLLLRRALELVGTRTRATPAAALRALASAGGFSVRTLDELAHAYAERGDSDVARLLYRAAQGSFDSQAKSPAAEGWSQQLNDALEVRNGSQHAE